jgi:autotransporter-associated beta strand protein
MSLSSPSAAAPSAPTADLIVEGPNSPYLLTASASYGNVFVGYNDSGVLNHSDGTLTVSNTLSLGAYGPNGTYNLSGTGAISANSVDVRFGTLNQSAGTLTVSNTLSLDFWGTYNLSGGAFSAAAVAGGPNGFGTLNQTGGTFSVTNTLSLHSVSVSGGALSAGNVNITDGSFAPDGNFAVSGSGSVTSTGDVTLNLYQGNFVVTSNGSLAANGTLTINGGQGRTHGGELSGNGSISAATISFTSDLGMTQSGGTMTAGLFKAGGGGTTTYNLTGGTLSTGSEQLGYNGRLWFNHDGGTHTVTGDVQLGYSAFNGAHSEYWLRGGTFSIGGALRLYSESFSGSKGTFHLYGGTLRASSVSGLGTLEMDGGTLQAGAGGAFLGVKRVTVTERGAVIDTNGFNVTTAAYDNTGVHSALINDTTRQFPYTDGGLRKIGAGTLTLTGANTYNGATTVNAGTLAISGTLANTSGIVVNNGGTLALSGSTGSNRIKDAATVNLAGGTLNLGGLSEGAAGTTGIGALTLTATSTIDFGDVAGVNLIQFGGVGSHAAGTVLNIENWQGIVGSFAMGDQLLFAGTSSSFTSLYSDPNSVLFNGVAGYGVHDFGSYYEVFSMTPVPEPGTWAAGFLTAGLIAWTQRRRLFRTKQIAVSSDSSPV